MNILQFCACAVLPKINESEIAVTKVKVTLYFEEKCVYEIVQLVGAGFTHRKHNENIVIAVYI